MKLMSSVVFCILLLVLFQASSCNHYIDKVTRERKMQIMQGSMTFYPDSNILIYRSAVGLRMDSEILKSKPFYTKLPKGLKWYSIENSQSFVFYYSHQQVVIINIDLSNKAFMRDTVYEPTKVELNNFINSGTSDHGKYDIRKIEFDPQRKRRVIKKEAATILLYNITSENFNEFCEYLGGFRFL
jgi:hypothetical protein